MERLLSRKAHKMLEEEDDDDSSHLQSIIDEVQSTGDFDNMDPLSLS